MYCAVKGGRKKCGPPKVGYDEIVRKSSMHVGKNGYFEKLKEKANRM